MVRYSHIDGEFGLTFMVSSITVTHDDYATYTNDAYDQVITSLQDNFTIQMTCTKIKDVQISGKTLTYNGGEQELVSVTEVAGDTVEYYLNGATDPVSEVPKATDAGTYSVRVVVARTGYTTLDKTVQTVINPADIEGIDIAPVTGLKYNEANQALVTLTGAFTESDSVTWTVNGTDEIGKAVPERMAVGAYTVTSAFTESAEAAKNLAETLEGAIAKADKAINNLYDVWAGKGRNEFEKKYKIFEQQVADIKNGLWDLYEDIVAAEEGYIQSMLKEKVLKPASLRFRTQLNSFRLLLLKSTRQWVIFLHIGRALLMTKLLPPISTNIRHC